MAILQMRVDGPDAERMGSKDSYPSCIEAITRMSCRVGTWSGKHRVQRSVPVHAAEVPSALGNHPSPPLSLGVGAFSATCRRNDVQIGTIDAVLIQLCLQHDLVLLSTDNDFRSASKDVKFRHWSAAA